MARVLVIEDDAAINDVVTTRAHARWPRRYAGVLGL